LHCSNFNFIFAKCLNDANVFIYAKYNSKIMTDKKLRKALKNLPSGAVSNIATRVNLSKTTISNVLNGRSNSPRKPEILQAAAEYLTEYKAKEREAMQALQEAATA
jgi:transcriptional regulator with XRE-family HTH domain